jgi:hypothetical protein
MGMSSIRLSGCEYMLDVVRVVFCADAATDVSMRTAATDNNVRFM